MLIGLFVRHYKAFYNQHYINLTNSSLDNLAIFSGRNGTGKSSVLQALNTFFNEPKNWIKTNGNIKNSEVYVAPVFLIEKNEDIEKIPNIHKISEFFWNFTESKSGAIQEFEKSKKQFLSMKNTHFLFALSKEYENNDNYSFSSSFDNKISKALRIEEKNITSIANSIGVWVNKKISYVYFPVESSIEQMLKIEQKTIQEFLPNNIYEGINAILGGRVERKEKKSIFLMNYINDELKKFVTGIEKKLKNNCDLKGRKPLTTQDVRNLIIEAYFSKIDLKKDKKPIKDLSSGEQRLLLVNVIYSLFETTRSKNKHLIIAMDEPETSLHVSLMFSQFEKLYMLAFKNYAQVFLTTHWYGFLPTIDIGILNHVTKDIDTPEIQSVNLNTSLAGIQKIPDDLDIKSLFDLTSSIHTLMKEEKNNFIFVEGLSDKVYIEKIVSCLDIKDVKVIACGGIDNVLKLFQYLYIPLVNKDSDINQSKVICIVDTDSIEYTLHIKNYEKNKKIQLLRLNMETHNGREEVKLVKYSHPKRNITVIENSLDPLDFYRAISKVVFEKEDIYDQIVFRDYFKVSGNPKKCTIDEIWPMSMQESSAHAYSIFQNFLSGFIEKNKIKIAQAYNISDVPAWSNKIKDFIDS